MKNPGNLAMIRSRGNAATKMRAEPSGGFLQIPSVMVG